MLGGYLGYNFRCILGFYMVQCALYMTETETIKKLNILSQEVPTVRVYEVGYHIIPTFQEQDLDAIVGTIRSVVEKTGGTLISEGAPAMMKLAYNMEVREGDKYAQYDRAYFGWIKFEAPVEVTEMLDETLKRDTAILRFVLFRTVRTETRAKIKIPTMREVKRTDTIKPAHKQEEASAEPVSEEKLEEALVTLTNE